VNLHLHFFTLFGLHHHLFCCEHRFLHLPLDAAGSLSLYFLPQFLHCLQLTREHFLHSLCFQLIGSHFDLLFSLPTAEGPLVQTSSINKTLFRAYIAREFTDQNARSLSHHKPSPIFFILSALGGLWQTLEHLFCFHTHHVQFRFHGRSTAHSLMDLTFLQQNFFFNFQNLDLYQGLFVHNHLLDIFLSNLELISRNVRISLVLVYLHEDI